MYRDFFVPTIPFFSFAIFFFIEYSPPHLQQPIICTFATLLNFSFLNGEYISYSLIDNDIFPSTTVVMM